MTLVHLHVAIPAPVVAPRGALWAASLFAALYRALFDRRADRDFPADRLIAHRG